LGVTSRRTTWSNPPAVWIKPSNCLRKGEILTTQSLVEKQCRLTGQKFEVSLRELEIYSSFSIEPPDLLPSERLRVLASFQNGRHFSWRDSNGTPLYTNQPGVVIPQEAFRQLRYEGSFLELGLESSRPQDFFDDLLRLFTSAPRPAVFGNFEKSIGVTDVNVGDRLYFVSSSARVSIGSTSEYIRDSRGFANCLLGSNLKDCYACLDCHSSLKLAYSDGCHNCRDSYFLVGCSDCENCLFCVDLEGKSYCIDNKQVSKEEYEKVLKTLALNTRNGLDLALERYSKLLAANQPISPILNDLRNVNCYFVNDVDLCADILGYSEGLSESVLSVGCGLDAKRILGSIYCQDEVENIYYSAYCTKSKELLGCFGLEGREFCILNKQYSEADYYRIKEEVVASLRKKRTWGRPLPFRFSDFPYNRSLAQDLFPVSKVQSSLLEVKWDDEADLMQPSKILENEASMSRLQDSPTQLSDALAATDGVYICELSGRPFQYFPVELDLCERLNLIPSPYCYEERHRMMFSRFGNRE